jgi:Ca2+-binding EF-hand superfamily protein
MVLSHLGDTRSPLYHPDYSHFLSFYHYSYTQETTLRFRKEIMRAASRDQTDRIALDGMTRVLTNIGAFHRLSADEMKVIFQELGNETGEIPMQRMQQII